MPQWCAEFLAPERLIAAGTQADISQFKFSDAATLVLVAGAVTAGANKTLTITTPLEASIPLGTVLDFGGGKLHTLTTRAEVGATKLIGTLAVAVAGGETFAYKGVSGRTVVDEGVFVGRTFAERDAGAGFGPAALATDDEIYLVAFPNDYLEMDKGITLVRRRHSVYENMLPGWSTFSAPDKAKIRSLYDCLTLPVNN